METAPNSIDIMIFISIQPFALKKMFALGATLLCLSTASCFADAMFLSLDARAPQTNRVRQVVSPSTSPSQPVSFSVANQWVGDLDDIPYGYHTEWAAP